MKHKGHNQAGHSKKAHKAIMPMPPRAEIKSQAPQVGTHITNARNQLR
jgi:hypothetical protein